MVWGSGQCVTNCAGCQCPQPWTQILLLLSTRPEDGGRLTEAQYWHADWTFTILSKGPVETLSPGGFRSFCFRDLETENTQICPSSSVWVSHHSYVGYFPSKAKLWFPKWTLFGTWSCVNGILIYGYSGISYKFPQQCDLGIVLLVEARNESLELIF